MASAIVGAAFSVVGKALAPLTDPVLEAWAASKDLGPNVEALKTELLCVKAVLEPNVGSEIHNSALEELLRKLQDLAYNAEDVLDELDYFRIQDDLDGTFEAVDNHPKGCAHNLLHNARHTAKAVGKRIWSPACNSAPAPAARPRARNTAISSSPSTNQGDAGEVNGCMSKLISAPRCSIRAVGKCLPCSSLPPVHDDEDDDDNDHSDDEHEKEITKLEFDRVDVSKRIRLILEQLQPLCQKICMVLGALGSNSSRVTKIEQSCRPVTTSESIEPTLYGRDTLMNTVTSDITQGKYLANNLIVLPIVGPGGIGKTTFTQHLYQQVKSHFHVSIWICVSLSFNANRLAQEALKMIPAVNGEKETCSDQERIEQRLKKNRFLLVLDDMWKCHEDEWKTLLAPFRKGEEKGNMIIITTRLPDMAKMVKTVDYAIQLERLGTEDFMRFFEACVFDDHQQHKWKDQELLAVGMKIVDKLKGNPLAAKTVGRLLRNLLTLEHWTRVLESKEWELSTSEYDVMPALKVSYNYLPFHLQQCFSYCALFAEDYQFDSKELIHLWIGLGILHPCNRRRKIEDVGQSYIDDLVNQGFFKKEERDNGCPYYIVHDLLHSGVPRGPERAKPLLVYTRRNKAAHGAAPPRDVEVPTTDATAAQEVDAPADDAVCCTPPPGFGAPSPPPWSSSARRRFEAFAAKVVKPMPAGILRRPSPKKTPSPRKTPWRRPRRSRRIAAQSHSRLPASKRGEYLILKRLGQGSPLTESALANKFDALFGGRPEDDEALRELFPDGSNVSGRKRRRRAWA